MNATSGAPGQSYNLQTEPGKSTIIYVKYPEIVTELLRLIEKPGTSERSSRGTQNQVS